MPQSLQDKLYEDFKRKARENRLGTSNIQSPTQAPTQAPSPPKSQSPYPEWYTPIGDATPESNMLNAVGVGLWSFVDTASFGAAGALLKEEEFLDFEDPLAKWTGAIGGFAGFVTGAPLKVGAKIAQKALPILGKGALKKMGKQSVDEVVRGMKQTAKEGGLSKKATKDITTGYRSLVRQAQVDPRLRGLQFEERARKYLAQYADDAVKAEKMTEAEGAALQKMFGDNIFKRPIQDFMGLMQARGMAEARPRLAKVLGHSINDAIMFGAIDTIFEGVSMVEDRHFDITAPIWGAATGGMFGQLSWLKPRGKAASFKKDFISGMKSTFNVKAFGELTRDQLKSRAKFLGENLSRNGESANVVFSYGGKKPQNINLKSDTLWDDMKNIYGNKAEKALETLLEQQRSRYGKKMMRWAISEEATSLQQNWARMAWGGTLFNAHALYDSYFHEAEPDIHDVLSSFLIGAFVQRRSNPAKFDLNKRGDMNRLRSNMMILGVDPHQMATIPTFDFRNSRFESIFNNSKYESVLDLARELEIGGDMETVSKPLSEKEQSAATKPNLLFDDILPQLRNHFPHLKQIDQISAVDAKKIADAVIKIDSRWGDERGRRKAKEETFLETQQGFEDSFRDLIESINDPENTFKIEREPKKNGGYLLLTPKNIRISEDLKQKAKDGELFDESGKPLFGYEADGVTPIKGDKALDLLYEKVDSFQTALVASDSLGKSKMDTNPDTSTKTIESEALLADIYQKVSSFERNVESKFPDNTIMSEGFSISESYHDYANILVNNHSLRIGKTIIDTFSKKDDKLIGLMQNAGVMYSPELAGVTYIVDDVGKIEITGKDVDADQLSMDKRFISKVHALQAASNIGGRYNIFTISKGEIKITHQQVQQLRKELNSRGIDLDMISNHIQSRIVGQAVNERLKDSKLSLNQAEALWNLTGVEAATFGITAEGTPAGFTVRLVDESRIEGHPDSNMLPLAREYNQSVRKMIEDGKGLVVAEAETMKVSDMTYMKVLHSSIVDANLQSSQSARGIMADFMTQLGAVGKGYTSFVDQLRLFQNADMKNASIILNWLNKAGVIKSVDKATGIDFDLKKFNKQIRNELSRYMDTYGWDAKYVERIYKEAEQKGRDQLLEDSTERASEKPMSLQDFIKRYRIDGKDLTEASPEGAKLYFDEIIYSDKPNKILDVDILNKLLDRIHVERADGQWKSYTELSEQEKDWIKPDIRSDMIKVLGSQRAQVKIDVIKWSGGDIVKEVETVQFSRLHQKMRDLDLPYLLIDGRFPIERLSDDGRYIVQREINIFNDAKAVSKADRDLIRDIRDQFETFIRQSRGIFELGTEDYRDLVGKDGEVGLRIIEIAPGMDPIAVAAKDLVNLKEPFREFINEYKDREGLDHDGKRILREIEKKIEENEFISSDEYDHILTSLMMREMLIGNDGDRTFIQFMNGDKAPKLMSRIRLFNTKKYVRYNKDFVLDVADVYSDIKEVSDTARRIARNNGFGVAIWNDENYARIRDEIKPILERAGLDKDYLNNVIGDAHDKVSGFDSIGFVSRQQLMFMHAMAGNDPYSYNAIKPVITSGGANSPLLLGKTLFIYSPELNGFFSKNKNIDILLTQTGAKVYNPVGEQVDTSVINVGWGELNNQRNAPIRKISIESLGIMPNKNPQFMEAKLSQADANYMNNEESASMFQSEFSRRLEVNLESMSELMRDPIVLKEWVVGQLGDQGMIADIQAGESAAHTLNNLVSFSMHTRDANPRSYSDRLVENKIYQVYMDSVINGQRSATNQWNKTDSHRYGGNAVMIPGAMFGLKPTLVNKQGKKDMMGEAMLPSYTKDLTIKELSEHGYEMRFGRKGEENLKGEEVFAKEHWDELIKTSASLGEVVDALDFFVKQGEIPEGTSVQVMIRRNPRTRPNDFALMSLKGFLKEQYGNSIAINSLDVANVMEGDYDFDKADFFFSHRGNMWNHVKRASEFFVQGVDPTDLTSEIPWKLGMSAGEAKRNKHEMIATANAFKAGIGGVQKVPRGLGFLNNVGAEGKGRVDIENWNAQRPNQKFTSPKILLEKDNFKIVLDYDNLDFYLRSALETQYIIDADARLNPEIAQDLRTWRSEFIFPRMENSVVPNQVKGKVGFVNDMRQSGQSNGKRVRIFRKMVKKSDGTWDEVDLSKLDMSIINQMIYEYTSFLGVTRDSVYENTGSQKKTEYIDAFNGADRFMNFNRGMNNNLYYKLRNRYGSNVGKENSAWKNDPDFIEYFDVEDVTFTTGKGKYKKKVTYQRPRGKILHEDSIRNAADIAEGNRGAPIDRIMMNFRKADPLNTSQTRTIGTAANELVDEWYNELLGGGSALDGKDADSINERFLNRADKLTRGVISGARAHTRKVNFIRTLKKKIVMLQNSRMRYDAKKSTMENINSLIRKVEAEIGESFLPQEYLSSRKSKDLPKVEYVIADERNMIDGTIYYATMDMVRNTIPFDWSLRKSGRDDLAYIKKIRRLFYGNRTSKKDFLKFGGKSLLTTDELRLLNKFPDMSTFYQIESQLLADGFKKHGPAFLYQFMQPTQNRRAVGVFNNRPVTVPYEAKGTFSPSSRYRRGMRLLTSIAYKTLPTDAETVDLAKRQLSHIQFIESQNERFFNKRIDRKALIGEEVGEHLNVGGLDRAAQELIYSNMRLPNFDKDFEKLFGNFDSIKWGRDGRKISTGLGLTNDHLLDFYANVMKLAGKEKEFESYLNAMHDLNAQYIGYDFIDPIDYLTKRANMDVEVRRIAKDVFVDGIFQTELNKKNKTATDIVNNPVYALMGGAHYFKGVSLEKRNYNYDRLKQIKELADNMQEMKDGINPNSYEARKNFERMGLCIAKEVL